MSKKFYIILFAILVIAGIILVLNASQYYDSPEAVVLGRQKSAHPQIITTAMSKEGHPVVFFTSDTYVMTAMSFTESGTEQKRKWKFQEAVSFKAQQVVNNNNHEKTHTPANAGYSQKLDQYRYIYWGVALDECINNYTINEKEITTHEVAVDGQKYILWYIFEDHLVSDPTITEKG